MQDSDIAEVLAYRGGIAITAACTAAVTLGMVTNVVEVPAVWYNAACIVGGISFGVSLLLIHMYVAELKLMFQVCSSARPVHIGPSHNLELECALVSLHRVRAIHTRVASGDESATQLAESVQLPCLFFATHSGKSQVFFAFGAAGGAWLMATQDTALPLFVAEHQWATWAIGPAFAAVTGVAIKEGLCYGKLEAALLAFVRSTPPLRPRSRPCMPCAWALCNFANGLRASGRALAPLLCSTIASLLFSTASCMPAVDAACQRNCKPRSDKPIL